MNRAAAIEAVLGEIQERWGLHSLTRGYAGARAVGGRASGAPRAIPASALPSWWPGAEGYVRPNLVELSGPASCGKLGLALLWLGAASRGGLVAVVDQAGTFYPPAAAASGLDLERLVVVRPPDRCGAADAVSLLLNSAGFDAILWPVEWRSRPFGLDSARLSTLAARAGTTLLALVTDHRRWRRGRLAEAGTGQSSDAARLFPSADVRLRVTGWEWVWRDGELAGVRPRVRAERLRGTVAGQVWELHLERHVATPATGEVAGDEAPTRAQLRSRALAHRPGDDDPAGQRAAGAAGIGAAGVRPGRCPPTDHLCLAAALPLGGGGARPAGSPGAADRGVRPDPSSAPAARTA